MKFKPDDRKYFLTRTPGKKPDYEEAYWGVVKDPDGHIRDRTDERDRTIENLATEIEYVNSLAGGKILDLGCGPGFFLSALESKWKCYGLEISSYAAKLASRWGEIHHGTLESAQYESSSFDLVFSYHVIEHVNEPGPLIREIYRVLKPGGQLIMGTPDFDSACARRFKENYRLLCDDTHVSLFSTESMFRFLRQSGFFINHVDYPYFDIPWFTEENLKRLFDTNKISPPFYGNFMTFYCSKPQESAIYSGMMSLMDNAYQMADHFAFKQKETITLFRATLSKYPYISFECDEALSEYKTLLDNIASKYLNKKTVETPGYDTDVLHIKLSSFNQINDLKETETVIELSFENNGQHYLTINSTDLFQGVQLLCCFISRVYHE